MPKSAKKPPAAKAKASPASETKKRRVADNVVDAIDQAVFDSKAQSKRRRRSLDEEVNKCLKDNFKTWTPAMCDLHLVGGRSLRETITADKEALKFGTRTQPMGKYYYEELRSKFGASNDPASMLVIKDPSLPEDADLVVALRAVMQHCRDYAPINAFLATAPKLDQKNLVALLKCCLKISPLTSMDSMTFVLNIMRFLSRHSYEQSHRDEVSAMKLHFDAALSRSLNVWRNNERPVSEWWAASRAFAKLVLNEGQVENILQTKSLGLILEDLSSVCDSCETGRKMFSRAHSEAQFALVDAKLVQVLRLLDGQTEVTTAVVNNNRAAFAKEVKALGKSVSEAFKPKDKQFQYLGVDFAMPVSSIIDEYELRLAAKLRSMALLAGTLEPLWCELQLAGEPSQAALTKVAPELVQASATCRNACRDFLDGKDVTGEAIKELFSAKYTFLRQMDSAFQVEMHFFLACVGERGNERIKSDILAALPAIGKLVNPREALASLAVLERSKLFEFAGMGVRSVLTSIKAMVENIANERSPNFDNTTDSAYFSSVKSALMLFLMVEPAAVEGGVPPPPIFGEEALKHLYQEVAKDKDDGRQVALPRLRPLQTFSWGLSAAERSKLVDWVKNIVSSSKCGTSASEAMAKRQAKNKAQSSRQGADALVANLFT